VLAIAADRIRAHVCLQPKLWRRICLTWLRCVDMILTAFDAAAETFARFLQDVALRPAQFVEALIRLADARSPFVLDLPHNK
jgi:hypothetical protein